MDIGSGTGGFLEEAQKNGFDVLGVEPNPLCRNQCLKRGLVVIDELKGPHVNRRGHFDVITCWDGIGLFINIRDFFKSIFELLAPGGIFVLSTHNTDGFDYAVLGTKHPAFDGFTWRGYFNAENIFRIMNDTGFAHISITHTGTQDINYIQEAINLGVFKSTMFTKKLLDKTDHMQRFREKLTGLLSEYEFTGYINVTGERDA